MGMFKDMRNLQKMGNDMRANMPSPGEQMANAQQRMANAQQMMANQTAAATAAARLAQGLNDGTAIRCSAVVNSMQQVGMINFDLMIQFDLTLMQDGMPPRPATTQQTVSQMQIGQIRPGMTVDAAMDPSNPDAIWLNLTTAR
ncbi:MAG TPA: hypothetical protein VMR14_06610 [Streptosporangiaceae bacterium]|jgi:hypothetical protein|nr:hypothetical protein [Streptosporangiaceae bacterium]